MGEVKLALHVPDEADVIWDVEITEPPRHKVLVPSLRVDGWVLLERREPLTNADVLGGAEPLPRVMVFPFWEPYLIAALPGDADGGGNLEHLISQPSVAAELAEGYHAIAWSKVTMGKGVLPLVARVTMGRLCSATRLQ